MRTRGLFVIVLLLFGFTLGARNALAQLRLPSLPHLPNTQNLALAAASKRIAPYVQQQDPINLDWARTYPPFQTLPGAPFHAGTGRTSLSNIDAQLDRSTNGVVRLTPGDYEIPIRVYCSRVKAHSPVRVPEVYVLGPLRGAREDVLVALLSKVTAAGLTYSQVQPLSWAIQTGMRYSQLPPNQRMIFDRLIPQMRSRMSGNFIDNVRDQWNRLGIVGLPSFDSSLDRIGALGQTLKVTQQAQNEIVNNANNFDALSASLAPPLDVSNRGQNYQASPWGQVAPNVYMHTPSTGGTGALFTMQVRVTGSQGSSVNVPLLSNIFYPTYCMGCQPLTYNVEKTQSHEDTGEGIPG